jgi:hypothetical protein
MAGLSRREKRFSDHETYRAYQYDLLYKGARLATVNRAGIMIQRSDERSGGIWN